jgi:hypothetical protein
VQAQSARRPGYLTTDANGKPSVSFSASFPSVITNEFTFANAATVFAVAKNTNNSFGGMFQRGTVNERHSGFRNAGTITARRGSGNDATVPFTSSDYSVFQWSFGASLSLPGVNGVAGTPNTTSNSFASTAMPLRVGSLGDGSLGMIGGLSEFLYYEATLTDLQAAAVRRYLARKYGVTLTVIPTVANADAQDWINRVYQNGGTVSSATAAAVNTFCESIASAGIRDRFYRMGIFAGSNLNAALVPLYRGPSLGGTQYGNATDTNNAFVGIGTDYAETGATGGLTGNGTTKYLNTGFNVDQLPGAANCHLSSFITGTQDITSVRTLVGTIFNSVTDRYRLFLRTDSSTPPNYTLQIDLGKSEGASQINRTNTSGGLLVGSRTSTTNLSLYAGGVSAAAPNTNPTAETTGASPFFVFARNGPTEYYNGRMAAYSIGAGMTAAQVTAYNTAIQAFQTAMGRV